MRTWGVLFQVNPLVADFAAVVAGRTSFESFKSVSLASAAVHS